MTWSPGHGRGRRLRTAALRRLSARRRRAGHSKCGRQARPGGAKGGSEVEVKHDGDDRRLEGKAGPRGGGLKPSAELTPRRSDDPEALMTLRRRLGVEACGGGPDGSPAVLQTRTATAQGKWRVRLVASLRAGKGRQSLWQVCELTQAESRPQGRRPRRGWWRLTARSPGHRWKQTVARYGRCSQRLGCRRVVALSGVRRRRSQQPAQGGSSGRGAMAARRRQGTTAAW